MEKEQYLSVMVYSADASYSSHVVTIATKISYQ